jgi:CheY-like chemotaxis protein
MRKFILLADDNPTLGSLTRNYLKAHNCEVYGEASDGIDAIEKALELSPDLIVMDLSIPRKNGLEAARELKEKMPHVPIARAERRGPIACLESTEACECARAGPLIRPPKPGAPLSNDRGGGVFRALQQQRPGTESGNC